MIISLLSFLSHTLTKILLITFYYRVVHVGQLMVWSYLNINGAPCNWLNTVFLSPYMSYSHHESDELLKRSAYNPPPWHFSNMSFGNKNFAFSVVVLKVTKQVEIFKSWLIRRATNYSQAHKLYLGFWSSLKLKCGPMITFHNFKDILLNNQ